MPCNALATAAARIAKIENLEALLANPEAIEVMRILMAQLWEVRESDILVRKDRNFVRLEYNGRYVQLQAQAGLVAFPAANLDKIRSILDSVVAIALQLNFQKAVAANYRILEQQRAPDGSLLLTVDL
jgi:hypothetical protein